MLTNYEPAEILDLVEPRDFIRGEKRLADTFDFLTGDWSTIYIVAIDANDEERSQGGIARIQVSPDRTD